MKKPLKVKRTVSPPSGLASLLPVINSLPKKKDKFRFEREKTSEMALAYEINNPGWFAKLKLDPAGNEIIHAAYDKWEKEAEEMFYAEVAENPRIKRFLHPTNALASVYDGSYFFFGKSDREKIDGLFALGDILRRVAENGGKGYYMVPAYLSPTTQKAGRRTITALSLQTKQLFTVLLGVDTDRITICPVCRNIFWKGRTTQPACSANCRNTLRVRKWRKNQAKYEEKRAMTPPKDSKLRKGGK
jgi:hypothetical protein